MIQPTETIITANTVAAYLSAFLVLVVGTPLLYLAVFSSVFADNPAGLAYVPLWWLFAAIPIAGIGYVFRWRSEGSYVKSLVLSSGLIIALSGLFLVGILIGIV